MRYERLGRLEIPKVGFGTWSIGGGSSPNRRKDDWSLASLRSALELGYTHFDTAESYAAGHCEELLGRAVRESGTDRARLFITSKVKPENLTPDRVTKACERSLRRLRTEYLDLYLIHWPNPGLSLGGAFEALNRLVRSGKVKHLGVSNFDLQLLQQSVGLSETGILTDQVPYSVMERSYAANGVVGYCQANGILVTAYSPLEQGGLRASQPLAGIAQARSLTVQQAAIAWLCSQPRVITIPMSGDPLHQRENLAAADVMLLANELELPG